MRRFFVRQTPAAVVLLFALLPPGLAQTSYTFAVVPQHSAAKIARTWGPVIRALSAATGDKFVLKIDKNIPTFEDALREEAYDFAYMNPYHYVLFHDSSDYQAIAKARNKRIHGILVAHADSDIGSLSDLRDRELAFPSPRAFAASMLTRATLKQQQVSFTPRYVSSHDSVYLNVASKRFVAGGGVVRTLNTLDQGSRNKLKVIWKSPGYTPHAIAAHRRVPAPVVETVTRVLTALETDPETAQSLTSLKIIGFEKAVDSDWSDVRNLNLTQLD